MKKAKRYILLIFILLIIISITIIGAKMKKLSVENNQLATNISNLRTSNSQLNIEVEVLNKRHRLLEQNYFKLEEENLELDKKYTNLEIEKKEIEYKLKQTTKKKSQTVSRGSERINTNEGTTYLGTFKATAYCSCSKCCGPSGGKKTASGTTPTVGRTIAVDRSIIPLGTKVEINGKIYTAEDTGGAVKGKIVDIFFGSHSEALQFGRQNVEVSIVK